MASIEDHDLRYWVETRIEKAEARRSGKALTIYREKMRGLTEPDWRAIRNLVEDFGTDDIDERESARREMVVSHYMRRMARRTVGGTEYPAPYSLGLKVLALTRDRELRPSLYG